MIARGAQLEGVGLLVALDREPFQFGFNGDEEWLRPLTQEAQEARLPGIRWGGETGGLLDVENGLAETLTPTATRIDTMVTNLDGAAPPDKALRDPTTRKPRGTGAAPEIAGA